MSGVRYSPGLGETFCVAVGGGRGADLDGMGGRKVGGSCVYGGDGYAFSGGSGVGR